MARSNAPPRFVPTLTDVVQVPEPAQQPAPASAPAPFVPAAPASVSPPSWAARTAPTMAEASPAAPVVSPELVAKIADRVQAVLQERMALALHSALRDMRPLVHDAVIQALKQR
ncbi:hypothetical protein FOZ74_02865 [Comamonas flocculans]|uniref:Uncharacterized protein n=2 Tax=Comamonas flocculans TaxID=2597701 RepID=A0A5B8RSH6_9BURK|nr:hypothetical protein FOZ74_02865 [Comamonas flocculans]